VVVTTCCIAAARVFISYCNHPGRFTSITEAGVIYPAAVLPEALLHDAVQQLDLLIQHALVGGSEVTGQVQQGGIAAAQLHDTSSGMATVTRRNSAGN